MLSGDNKTFRDYSDDVATSRSEGASTSETRRLRRRSISITPEIGDDIQASWMVKKIFKAREAMGNAEHQISGNKSRIRSIYLSMIGQLPKVTWKNLMCGNIARPKAIFITWLQLQYRLRTATRLQSWGLQIDTACHMCKQAEETKDHLFAECEVSNRVWSKLMRWIQIDWPAVKTGEMQKWIEQRTKGKTKQAKIVKMIYT